jgi:MFS family permease
MLPGIKDWLAASWADYRRRWLTLMAVLSAGTLATVAGMLLPLIPGGIAAYLGAWWIFGAAYLLSMLLVLSLSAWAQAAFMRSAANDEGAGEALRRGWKQTPAFAWVLSLSMLAAGGGFVLLILPGLVLGVLLFFAPFYQLAGEARGLGALELSWARVRPVLGAASWRLSLLALIGALLSWIPYVGWLTGFVWAPFAVVACARLADDLKSLNPEPARPSLGPAVAALSCVFLAASVAVSWSSVRGGRALYDSYASGKLALKTPDAETAQSMMAVLQGHGTEEDSRRSTTYVLSLSSAAAAP